MTENIETICPEHETLNEKAKGFIPESFNGSGSEDTIAEEK